MTADADLPDELRRWMAGCAGAEVLAVHRASGGTSRQAWLVDVAPGPGRPGELFLRRDSGHSPLAGTTFSLGREAAVVAAVGERGLRVPRVLGTSPDGGAVLTERVAGDERIDLVADVGRQQRIAEEYVDELARLHRLDPSEVGALGPVPDDLGADVALWGAIADERARPDPLLLFTRRWLERNLPPPPERWSVVHGDAGPGNFLFAGDRVTAVLDWELCHVGDPLEDLAWVALRSALLPWVPLPPLFARYAERTGQVLDRDRLRHLRALVQYKALVVLLAGMASPSSAHEVGFQLIYRSFHRRLLVEGIAEASGHPLGPVEPLGATEPDEDDALAGVVLDLLRDDVVPALADRARPQHQAKSVARIVKYLAERHRRAGDLAARTLDDVTGLLGHRPADPGTAQRELGDRIRRGDLDDGALLDHLHRVATWETSITAPAMGRLATRPFPAMWEG